MKELAQIMVEALVDYPDDVKIDEIEGGQTTVLELSVAKSDLGKVIGKQGRTAAAIRTILNCASVKTNKRVILEILE